MEDDAVRKILGLGRARGRRYSEMGDPYRGQSHVDDGLGAGYGGRRISRASSEGLAGGGDAMKDRRSEGEELGSSSLCLLLNNLGQLFRWDVASTADICADAFPGVRPW